MSGTQHTPANPETHTCGMCGYTWRHGQHGGHDCATRLKAQRDELVEALQSTYDALCISYPLHSVDADKRFGILGKARAAIARSTAPQQTGETQ